LSLFANKNRSQYLFRANLENKTDATPKKLDFGIIFFWGLFLAFYVSSELFFTTRTVLLFKDHYGFSIGDSNTQLTLFFVGLFIGRLIVSFVPRHISSFKILNFGLLSSIISILLGLVISPLFFATIGFWMSVIFPISMDEISNQTGSEFKIYSSWVISMSSLGVVIMHMMTGVVADSYGIYSSCFIPFVLMILAFVINLKFAKKAI
jgi:fucose permease